MVDATISRARMRHPARLGRSCLDDLVASTI
jgi:hypothetical protein